MTDQKEKCNIYRVTPKGTLKSIIDDEVVVSDEVLREINIELSNFLREDKVRKGEYFYSSQSITDPKTTLDNEE